MPSMIDPQSYRLKSFLLTDRSKKELKTKLNLELTNKARKNKFKQDKKQFKANLQKKNENSTTFSYDVVGFYGMVFPNIRICLILEWIISLCKIFRPFKSTKMASMKRQKKKKITETPFNGPGHVDLILTDKILFETEFLFSRLIFETV